MLWEEKCLIGQKIWLYTVLKHINRLVIRLKVIKYKKNFFCYLSFYLSSLDF